MSDLIPEGDLYAMRRWALQHLREFKSDPNKTLASVAASLTILELTGKMLKKDADPGYPREAEDE